MTSAHMLRNHVTSAARGSDQARSSGITARLDDGPLQGIRIEAEVVEGRPPSTVDVPADDSSTCRWRRQIARPADSGLRASGGGVTPPHRGRRGSRCSDPARFGATSRSYRQEAPQQPRRFRSWALAVGLRHLDHLGRVKHNPAGLPPAMISRLPDLPAHCRLSSLAAFPHVPSRPPGVVTSGLPNLPAHRLARLDVLPHLPSRPPGVSARLASGGELDQPRSHGRVDRDLHQAPPDASRRCPPTGPAAERAAPRARHKPDRAMRVAQ